jgi:glycine/D-amino acid oxidase-like deaminating enzyme
VAARFDVAVVGGGLLGVASAYHLADGGARVVLLEKDQLNAHASGQNAGSLHFQLEFRMVEHGDAIAAQFARHLPLVLAAQAAWARLGDELGEDVEVVQAGGIMCAETEGDVVALRRKHGLESRWGLETELLGGDEVRAIAPYLAPTVTAAAYCRTEGHANPRLVGPAYARAALQRGAVIRTNAPVVALDRRKGSWQVRIAGDEDVEVDAVLVAAGVWTGEVAAMADVRLPVVPVALSMIATEPVAQFVPHLVQHVGRRLSLKQAHDGNVLVGGGWASRLVHRHGVVELDARPELRFDSLAGNAWTAARVVPALGDVAVLRAWSGVAPVTADQLPIVGPVPRRPGLFVAAGGPGFTLAPVLSRLVAEIMLGGRSSLDLEDYDPQRFAHLTVV